MMRRRTFSEAAKRAANGLRELKKALEDRSRFLVAAVGALALSALVWILWVIGSVEGALGRLAEIGKILTPLVLLFGLFVAWSRTVAAHKQALTAEQGHVTERFSRAIDQLGQKGEDGKKNMAARLGGIYALEKIAQQFADDYHWTVMNVLCAYVREERPVSADKAGPQSVSADIQAILTVLGENNITIEENQDLDFLFLDLRKADLSGAELVSANLTNAHLREADLRKAWLWQADLRKANLNMTDLKLAELNEADLRGVYSLTQVQVDAALGDSKTKLPDTVKHPPRWEYLGLLWDSVDNWNVWREKNPGEQPDLSEMDFIGTDFIGADLSEVDLSGANLTKASFDKANLNRTDLTDANLTDANLCGVDLSKAKHLSQLQVDSARGDESTILPTGNGIGRPAHWINKSRDDEQEESG